MNNPEYIMSRIAEAIHAVLKEEGYAREATGAGFILGVEMGEEGSFQTYGNLTRQETINFLISGLQNMTGKQVLLTSAMPAPNHAVKH